MFGDGNPQKNSPEILEHDLNRYFPELLKFESIEETEKSAVYQKIRPTVERILNAVVQEEFSDAGPKRRGDEMRDEGRRMRDELKDENNLIPHPSSLIPQAVSA